MLNAFTKHCRLEAGVVEVPALRRPPPADDQKRHQEEDPVMKKFVARASVVAFSAMLAFASAAQAQTKSLTLCWAAWDPANALVELSKDFTTKTGMQMKFEFVPWPNFADRMLNELNSKGKLCDS
jgi:hypothetical protein